MKKTARAVLVAFARNDWRTMHTDRVAATAYDALASDAAQRATIRDLRAEAKRKDAENADLKARLEVVADSLLGASCGDPNCRACCARNLKLKNWRKP